MVIGLLSGGPDRRIPRLYQHDLESFIWALAYTTVANIEYAGRTTKVFPPQNVDTWFKDHDQADRQAEWLGTGSTLYHEVHPTV